MYALYSLMISYRYACIGVFFLFDGMTFPAEQPSPSLFQKVADFFTKSDKDVKAIPSHFQSQADSLHIFLEEPQALLMDLEVSAATKFNFKKFVDRIEVVYLQLRYQNIYYFKKLEKRFSPIAKVLSSLHVYVQYKSICVISCRELASSPCSPSFLYGQGEDLVNQLRHCSELLNHAHGLRMAVNLEP